MATIENLFTGKGSTLDYSFTFPYLAETDIKISLGGVITTNWTLHNATTVRFSAPSGGATTYQEAGGAPKSAVAIRVYRDTNDESLRATFYPGSAIRANDLNENALQNLYVTQEAHDKLGKAWSEGDETIDSTEVWAGNDTRVATTGAIDGRIDAKILTATTEMPVSKLADGDARQVLQTAANGSDVEWTSNVDLPGTLDVTGNTTLDGTLDVTGNTTFTGSVTATTFTGEATKIATAYGNYNANHYLVGVHPYTDTGGVVPRTTASLQYHPVSKKLYGGFDIDLSNTVTTSQVYSVQAKKDIHLLPNGSTVPTIKWWEVTGNGSAYVGIKGPDDITGGSYSVTLPASSPGADKVLKTGSSGSESTLVWGDAPAADGLSASATVTAAEQAAHSVDDATYFTTSASDARYFNISSGDTIKDGDTFPDNDTTIATTAAINDRIIDLVDDVGGFVAIASENHFPNANPDVNNGAGTIVSIKELSENIVTGSGVTSNNSIAQTVGGTAVNITGLTQSTTYAAGFGMLVETTTTLNEYTFHRLTPKATEVTTVAGIGANITTVAGIAANVTTVAGISANVTTVAGIQANVTTVAGVSGNVTTVATNIADVNNFADLYQIASSDPGTDGGGNALSDGDMYFNSSSNELKVYNGSAWQGGVTATGNLVSKAGDTLTGDLVIDNAKEIRLSETDANGSHYLGFKAPDSVTANVTLALPDGAGSNGQYLKTNGSDTLSWGSVDLSAYAPLAGATFTGAIAAPSATFTDDGASQVVQIKTDDGAVYALRISNDTYSTSSLVGLRVYQEDDGDITLSHRGDSEYRQFWISQSNGTTSRALYGGSTTGACYLYHAGSSKLNTTASGITVTGSVTDDKGDVRNVPKNYKTGAYTLLASDAGKCITTEANVTIDPNVMSDGDVVTIVNNTASDITITRGTNVILYNSADATDSNKTLAGRGMCTMWFMNSAHAYVTGAGLS